MPHSADKPTRVPPVRVMFYSVLITALVFGLLELVLSLCGIKPAVTTEDPYVGFEGRIPLFVPGEGTKAGYHVTAANKQSFFNPQAFKSKKPSGMSRVFCLGGSTTYGRPHKANTSFSAWLSEYLIALAPLQEWEVVNAGGISYASYRVVKLMEELTAYTPDYFVVYTGHNEFLEERTYGELRRQSPVIRGLRQGLRHTRLYSMMERALGKPPTPSSAPTRLPREVHTVLDDSVGPAAYRRNDVLHDQIREHFENSLRRIVELSRSCGAKLVFVTPACSLNDCSPFKSECTDAENEGRIDGLLHDCRAAMNSGRVQEAQSLARAAVSLEPRHAHAHYELARALLAEEATEEAREHFRIARDEDIVPLRAPSDFVETVRRVASEAKIPLVDFEALATSEARHPTALGIPGKDLFMDHVHPTIKGHGIVARALVQEMIRAGGLKPTRALTSAVDAKIEKTVGARVDLEASGLALRNLAKVLSWAGKNEDAARLAARSIELVGEDAECSFILGMVAYDLGDLAAAERHYSDATRLDPTYVSARHNLALARSHLGRAGDAIRGLLQILEEVPEHPNARFTLAQTYMRADRFAEAAAAFKRYLLEDAEDADAYYLMGRCYTEIDEGALARKAFVSTLGLNPDDPSAHYELALLDLESDDVRSAQTRLKRALELDPDWALPRQELEHLSHRQ